MRCIVHADLHDKFVWKLLERDDSLVVGNSAGPVHPGPIIEASTETQGITIGPEIPGYPFKQGTPAAVGYAAASAAPFGLRATASGLAIWLRPQTGGRLMVLAIVVQLVWARVAIFRESAQRERCLANHERQTHGFSELRQFDHWQAT
ncbi:hypothetical protein GCM10009715_13130 [Paeniglutamicibacter psychrophenolicus]|uniref:Uncharacterized protein n=1 Tax=Paeniglutamicibacter psychrophenolicus TaxID=257454 RepID=A0ABS4W8M4_9MICC|nr:hypothetical protein [Paeniglutamicibacter psychrophenolicus]